MFAKFAHNAAALGQTSSTLCEEATARLDSLLFGAADLLAEANLAKLNSTALKSTFISRVACGERHVLFLTSSGFVYSMGYNEMGQLGNPCEEIEREDGTF